MNETARDSRQIGHLIRRARRKCGLSQSELGRKTALGQDTISAIENGLTDARLSTLLAILGALDLELQISRRNQEWDPTTNL